MRSCTWLGLLVLMIHTNGAAAQSYPRKPVRLVTAAAGAGGDLVSRVVAAGLTELWGQPVVIDNRGGSAVIPIELVTRAPPDGYTLLAFGSTLWHLPLMQSVAYDPVKELAPVTQAEKTPLIVVVHPLVPVKSIQELGALAKKCRASLLRVGHFRCNHASVSGTVQVHGGRSHRKRALQGRRTRADRGAGRGDATDVCHRHWFRPAYIRAMSSSCSLVPALQAPRAISG